MYATRVGRRRSWSDLAARGYLRLGALIAAGLAAAVLTTADARGQGWTDRITGLWADRKPVDWSYRGARGPEHWGDLAPEFSPCKGAQQSPIDLGGAQPVDYQPISFHYRSSALSVVNDGHSVRVNYLPGSYLWAGDRQYELKELDFHVPGEHRLNGRAADMEMHLLHKGPAGELAVVAVPMRAGRRMNSTLTRIWDQIPPAPGEFYGRELGINAVFLLPADRSYFTYVGSLTTPPCTEGVRWFVLAQPVEVDGSYVQHLLSLLGNNARPVQPVNGRTVLAVMRP